MQQQALSPVDANGAAFEALAHCDLAIEHVLMLIIDQGEDSELDSGSVFMASLANKSLRASAAVVHDACHAAGWKPSRLTVLKAASKGWLHVIKTLYADATFREAANDDTLLMDEAACNGHIHVLVWLHEHGKQCTTQAMDSAAMNGRLEVLVWLHEHGKQCTTQAMDWSARSGHLGVLVWLHEHGQKCTTAAIDGAAGRGHLHVIRWLHANCKPGWTARAAENAGGHGHMEVLQWLFENSHCVSAWAMGCAASMGRLPIVQWLHRRVVHTRNSYDHATMWAEIHGHSAVARWIRENRPAAL